MRSSLRHVSVCCLMVGVIGGMVLAGIHPVSAEAAPLPIPSLKIGVGEAKDPGEVSVLLQILFLMTILTLAPAILVMMTSFTRIVIVFHFLRQALGTPRPSASRINLPPLPALRLSPR